MKLAAAYEILEDGIFYGRFPTCPGVWANEATLENCREVLQEVLEDWIALSLRHGDYIPVIDGLDINQR